MRMFFKITITIVSILGIVLGCGLITTAILDTIGLLPMNQGGTREYTASFYNGDDLIYSHTYNKGDKMTFDFENDIPNQSDVYEEDGTIRYFKGWDWNGDTLVDHVFPSVAYFSFDAKAVYKVVEPEKSSEDSSGDSDSGGGWFDFLGGKGGGSNG